jgi:hypothetical protein
VFGAFLVELIGFEVSKELFLYSLFCVCILLEFVDLVFCVLLGHGD